MLRVGIEHSFRGFTLAANFTAPSPGITVLFGPSGAGKSTVLAAIAGLLRVDRARVVLGSEPLDRLPPERRRIGMVFQDGRLFPHRTVRQNLLYGLRRAPRGPIFPSDIVDLLGLKDLLGRRPAGLSGGERQRVAIGRALLSQPRILLMDEPLASLDDARRAEILPYLLRLKETLRLPVVYVTHALPELTRLADHVVLMDRGRVTGEGPLADVASRVDLALAARDDAAGVLVGQVHSHDPDRRLSGIASGGALVLVPRQELAPGTKVRLRVPARDVIIALRAPSDISVNNLLPATVCALSRDEVRHVALVELDAAGGTLLARLTLDAADRLHLRPGSRVVALVKSTAIDVLPG